MAVFKHDDSDMCKELHRVFSILQQSFTKKEFDEISNIPSRTLERRYGTWTAALEKSGLLKKFNKIKVVKKEIEDFNPDEQIKEKWKKEKGELVSRAEERKNKWLRQQVQKIDLLKEMLDETLAKAEPPVVDVQPIKVLKRPSKVEQKHITLVFHFSDLQLGTLITAEEMNGINKHNWTIFKHKLSIWTKGVIEKITEYKEQYIVDHVVIAALGDFVEGVDIFAGQTWKVDRHVVDQAIFGAADTAASFIEIFKSHPEISFAVVEVLGNHGRIGRKGDNPFSCSFDRVYLRMAEMQVKAACVKNVTWNENNCWFYFLSIYNRHHLFLHGDQGLGGLWSNRPTINSLEKGAVRWSQLLQQQLHYIHCGHFHSEANISFNMSQILINGSFVGTSDFAARIMVTSSPPLQMMHAFEPEIGLSKTERIYLTEGDTLRSIDPNILDN